MTRDTSDLESWAERLSSSGLPIFSATVGAVSGVVSRQGASAHDLAGAIGQDASLSAKLLKIANSPLFNLQNRDIDTISSAVVLLGFDAVRELAVSLALIEQVLQGRSHTRVTQDMARAFHAAAQARSFAVLQRDECPEEVFVAALLLNIGEMAFWSTAGVEAADIEQRIRSGDSLQDAVQQVLGFSFPALTARLVEEWSLGRLLTAAIADSSSEPRVAGVLLGHEVARCVEEFGWASAEAKALVERVAEHLGVKPGLAGELVKANSEEAGKIARRYGVPRLDRFLVDATQAAAHDGERSTPAAAGDVEGTQGKADPGAQLRCLQEIATHLEGGLRLDELIRLVLEGVHDGIGFDSCYFALLSKDRASLSMKLAVGRATAAPLQVAEGGAGRNLFSVILASRKALHVTDAIRRSLDTVFTGAIAAWIADSPFVVTPVVVAGKPVGVLYADNAFSGRPIDEDAFSGFRHFGQQIALGLAHRDA